MTDYLLYQLDDSDGRPVEASGSKTDEHAAQLRAVYRHMRDRLAEMKETHGCGYRPTVEAVTT